MKKKPCNSPTPKRESGLFLEKLEPRILYSGAPLEAAPEEAGGEGDVEFADVGVAAQSSPGQIAPPFEHPQVIQLSGVSGDSWQRTGVVAGEQAEVSWLPALEELTQEAARRWAATGLSGDQWAALSAVSYEVRDLGGAAAAFAEDGRIVIDDDAAGLGWFVDATPSEDEEFAGGEAGTRFLAPGGDAATRLDLLTILMHEQGHVLGLLDRAERDGWNLMYNVFDAGERRLPGMAQASGAVPGSLEGAHFAVVNHGGNGAVTVTDTTVGGVPYVQGADSLAFSAGTGGVITLDTPDNTDIVVTGFEFVTDQYDVRSANGERLIIADGGQIAMLEDGDNDHNEFLAGTTVRFGTEVSGQTGWIINEDNSDILYFRGVVDVQGNSLTITSGEGRTQLVDGAAFDTSDSDEDIRFEATSSLVGTGPINLTGDAFLRIYADNTATYSGNWTVTGGQGNPSLIAQTTGAFGTGSVTLTGNDPRIIAVNGVDLSNAIIMTNTGANKTVQWDGVLGQNHSGSISSAVALSTNADLTVTTASNTVTLSGQLSGAGWLDKGGSGTLVLTNPGNASLASFRVDAGKAIVGVNGADPGTQVFVSGNGQFLLGDGVTVDTPTLRIGNDAGTKVYGLRDGAISGTIASNLNLETDANADGRGGALYAGPGGTLTITGQIRDANGEEASAGITKLGLGTVVLTNPVHTYGNIGAAIGSTTTISAGTLLLRSGAALPVSTNLVVQAGAFFGGAGSVSGLASVTFQPGSGLSVDVNSSGTPLLDLGALGVDGLNLNLNVLALPGDGAPLTILSNVSGQFANAADGATLVANGNVYTITYSGTDVQMALVGAAVPETDVRIDASGNLIIEDVNGASTNDRISLSIVGSNYVITSLDPENILQATAGTLLSPNSIAVPISSVTGGIEVLAGGGADTLYLSNSLTLNGRFLVDSADVVTGENLLMIDTSAADGNILLGGTVVVNGGLGTLAFEAGSGNITISGNEANLSNFRVVRHSGTGVVTIDSDILSTGGMTFDGVNSTNNSVFVVNGEITGSGSITLQNDAHVTIAGDNSGGGDHAAQTGNWTINALVGDTRMNVRHAGALGTGTVTLTESASYLSFDVDGVFANNITMTNTGNEKNLSVEAGRTVELSGSVALNELDGADRHRFFVFANASLTISGVVTEAVNGDGIRVSDGNANSRFVLTNPGNTIRGAINQIDPGSLVFTSNGAAGGASKISLQDTDAALVLKGTDFATTPLSVPVELTDGGNQKFIRMEDAEYAVISSPVTILEATAGNARLDIIGGRALEFTGVFNASGAGGVRKLGGGTVTLSNLANSSAGVLDVDAGSVLVNGGLVLTNATLAADIGPGGVLGGSGTITNGALINVAGGSIRPGGDSAPFGSLTVTGDLTLDAASTVQIRTDAAGNVSQLIAGGALQLGGATLQVVIDPGFTPTAAQTLKIIEKGSAVVSGTFADLMEGATVYGNGVQYLVSYAGGVDGFDVVLTENGVAPVELQVNLDGSGNLTVTDVGISADSADTLTISETSTHYVFTSGGARMTIGTDATGSSLAQTSPTVISVLKSEVVNLTVETSFTGNESDDASLDTVNLDIDPDVPGAIVITADTINLNSASVSAGTNLTLTGTKILHTDVSLIAGGDLFLLDGHDGILGGMDANLGVTELNGRTLTIDVTGSAGHQTGRISGSGTIVKTGAGVWNLMPYVDVTNLPNNNTAPNNGLLNDFTGGVVVMEGTLTMAGGSGNQNRAINSGAVTVTIGDGATLELNRANVISDTTVIEVEAGGRFLVSSGGDLIGTVTGSGTLELQSGTLQLRNASALTGFSGEIIGSSTLALYGRYNTERPWILNEPGTGTYTGTILVGNYGGTAGDNTPQHGLYINGTTSATRVDVRSLREDDGSKAIYLPVFGGTGTLDGHLDAEILGTIQPGQDGLGSTAVGTFTVNGNVTLGMTSSDTAITALIDENGVLQQDSVTAVFPANLVGQLATTKLEFRVDGANNASDRLVVNGNVDISRTHLDVSVLSVVDDAIYTLIAYTGTLSGGEFASVSLPAGYELNFETPGEIRLVTSAPAIIGLTPGDNSTDVSIFGTLTVEFNQSIQAGTGTVLIRRLSDNAIHETLDVVADAARFTYAGTRVIIDPLLDMEANTGYYVEIAPGAFSDGVNGASGITGSITWNFTTGVDPFAGLVGDTGLAILNGRLLVKDINSSSADRLTIREAGGFYEIRDTSGLIIDGSLLGAGAGSTVLVDKALVTAGIQFQTDFSDDQVTLVGPLTVTGPILVDAEQIGVSGVISASGIMSLTGEVILDGVATLDTSATNSAIYVNGSINGASDLAINPGAGAVNVTGAVGGATRLGTLSVSGANASVNFQGGVHVTTLDLLQGAVTVDGGLDVSLAASVANSISGVASQVSFSAFLTVSSGAVTIGSGGAEDFFVGRQSGTNSPEGIGIVDFSAASSVMINVDRMELGKANSGGGAGSYGELSFSNAGPNTITALIVEVGDSPADGNTAVTSRIVFGSTTNDLFTNTLEIGGQKALGAVTIAAGGVLNLAGKAGAGTLADLLIGYNNANTVTNAVGTMNMSGGTFYATLNELILGQHNAGAGSAVGTLIYDAGLVSANSVLIARPNAGGTSSNPGNSRGTLTLGGSAILETISLSKGHALGVATFNWNGGTIRNRAGSDLSIGTGILLGLGAADGTLEVSAGQVAQIAAGSGPVVGGAGKAVLNLEVDGTGAGASGRVSFTDSFDLANARLVVRDGALLADDALYPLVSSAGGLSNTFASVSQPSTAAAGYDVVVAPGSVSLQLNAADITLTGNDGAGGAETPILIGSVGFNGADGTDFGAVGVSGGTITRTFTIANTGTQALSGINVGIVEDDLTNLDFSVTTLPAASVAAGDTTTFEITFDPASIGAHEATVTVSSNDPDEGSFTFRITGQGSIITGTPDSQVAVVNGKIVFTDSNGGASDDALTITQSGGYYVITDASQLTTIQALGGTEQVDAHTVRILESAVTDGLTIDALGGNDTVRIQSDFSLTGDLAFNGVESIILEDLGDGSITITTTGSQNYSAPVTLASHAILQGTDVMLQSTVEGAQNLTVQASGVATFGGAVGAVSPLLSLDTSGSAATRFGLAGVPVAAGVLNLNWDAALDRNNDNFWDSTINAQSTRTRWDFVGTGGITPVDVNDPVFLGITKAFDFGAMGNGATMLAWDSELSMTVDNNPTDNNVTFEIIFSPLDLMGTHVLFETGNGGSAADGVVLYLEDGVVHLVANDGGVTASASVALAPDAAGKMQQIIFSIERGSGNFVRLWHNGVLAPPDGTAVGTFDDWGNTDDSGLGRVNGGVAGPNAIGDYTAFDGKIAVMRFYYNLVFSDADALQNYTVATTPRSGLVTIETSGAQVYGNGAVLETDVSLTGSAVSFQGNLDDDGDLGSPSNLTITTSAGDAVLGGNIGQTSALSSLTVVSAADIDVDGAFVTTVGEQLYTATELRTSTSTAFQSATGNLTFNANTQFAGSSTFTTVVGNGTAVTSGNIVFTGPVTFNGPAILNVAEDALFQSTVTLGGDLSVLSTRTGSSAVFSGAVTGTAAHNMVVDVRDFVSLAAVQVGSLNTGYPGRAELGGNVDLSGSMNSRFSNQVLLKSSVTITTIGAGSLTFGATVDSDAAGAFGLTVNVAGDVAFRGSVGSDALSALSRDSGLASLEVTALGTVTVSNGGMGFISSLNESPYVNAVASEDDILTDNLWRDLGGGATNGNLTLNAARTYVSAPTTAYPGIHGAWDATATTSNMEAISNNLSDEDTTIEIWFRDPDGFSGDRVLWETGSSANAGASLYLQGSVLTFAARESTTLTVPLVKVSVDLSTFLTAQEQADFVQVSAVYDRDSGGVGSNNDSIHLYVNGRLAAEISGQDLDDYSVNSGSTGLGVRSGSTGGFDAPGDEITTAYDEAEFAIYRVWRQALTPTQVAETFTNVTGPVDFRTSGVMRVNATTVIEGDVSVTSSSGDLEFAGPVSGTWDLSASAAAGVVTFGGAVDLDMLQAGGTRVDLGGDVTVAQDSDLAFTSPVRLTADVRITHSGSGDIVFASTVDGAHALTTQTATGQRTAFQGDAGSDTALASMETGVVSFGAVSLNTTGDQTFGNAVLTGSTVLNAANVFLPGTVDLGLHGLTIDVTGVVGSAGGIISGAGTVTKSGTGTFTLAAANAYTGESQVSAGTLRVTGSLAGSVQVAAAAILEGTGSVAGTLILAAGGIVNPGVGGVGTLGSGSIDGSAGGVMNFDVNGVAPASDLLAVSGAIDLTGTTLNVTGTVTGLAVETAIVLLSNDDVDLVTGTFAGLAEGAPVLINGERYEVSYVGGDGNDVVLIRREEAAVVTIATSTNGAEPSTGGRFEVIQSVGKAVNTVVTYTVTGTAAPGSDYTALSGTVTILAGETSAFIDVSVLDDGVLELPETVIVALTGITSGDASVSLGTSLSATVTIADDEIATVSIAATADGAEPAMAGQFTVTLSQVSFTDTVVNYSVAGSATPGADYTALSGSVTIAAGATTATISVPVLDDADVEGTETVLVTLTGVSGGPQIDLGAVHQATVNIADDDVGLVTIENVTAGEGGTLTFTATLSQSVPGGFTVEVSTVAGTATGAGVDYIDLSGYVLTFAGTAGETQTFTVTMVDDDIVEPEESFTLALANVSNPLVDITDTAIGTITDNDTSQVTIDDVSVAEGSSLTFTLTLSQAVAGGVSVDVSTIVGTATDGGVDYSGVVSQTVNFTGTAGETQTFTVTTTEDALVEDDETFTVALSNSTNAAVSTGVPATGTILDNDSASVTIAAAANAAEPSTGSQFTITLSQLSASDTVVSYNVTGTAADGVDHTLVAGTVTIAAGQTSATLDLDVIDDLLVEGGETVVVSLTGVTGNSAISVASPSIASVTITDDDTAGLVVAEAGSVIALTEGDTSSLSVSLLGVPTGNVFVLLTPSSADLNLGAGPGVPRTLTFQPGNAGTPQTVTVIAVDDAIVNADRTAQVTFSVSSAAPGYTGLTAPAVTISISNDDVASPPSTTPPTKPAPVDEKPATDPPATPSVLDFGPLATGFRNLADVGSGFAGVAERDALVGMGFGVGEGSRFANVITGVFDGWSPEDAWSVAIVVNYGTGAAPVRLGALMGPDGRWLVDLSGVNLIGASSLQILIAKPGYQSQAFLTDIDEIFTRALEVAESGALDGEADIVGQYLAMVTIP